MNILHEEEEEASDRRMGGGREARTGLDDVAIGEDDAAGLVDDEAGGVAGAGDLGVEGARRGGAGVAAPYRARPARPPGPQWRGLGGIGAAGWALSWGRRRRLGSPVGLAWFSLLPRILIFYFKITRSYKKRSGS